MPGTCPVLVGIITSVVVIAGAGLGHRWLETHLASKKSKERLSALFHPVPVLFCHHPLLITNTPPASRSHGSQDTQRSTATSDCGDFAQTWGPALRPQGFRAVSRQWTGAVRATAAHPPTLSDCRPPMEDSFIWIRA